MSRAESLLNRVALLALASLISMLPACSGCQRPPSPPTERAVRFLSDPYQEVALRGELPDLERAAQVLEATGRQLGYGDAPGRAMRLRAEEAWAKRHALLIAAGNTKQLRAAWQDMVDTWTVMAIPQEIKFEAHLGLGRVWDLEGEPKTEEQVLRNAYLAELAYGYTLLLQVPVGESPPAPTATGQAGADAG